MSVDAANRLIHWYDLNARALPWRARAGERPDPYRVWLSEIMLQQTTVAAVKPYFEKFTTRWPTVEALAGADEGEVMAAWAGLGYYARARNLIACARKVAESGGLFPDTEEGLRTLPGIGRYTAAAIAAIAFGRRAVVVDANVERVVSRMFAVEEPLPASRPRLYALTDGITPHERAGDLAQAMMDLGSTICTPRDPQCLLCPVAAACSACAEGGPARYPLKAAKKARPRKQGIAYWLQHEDHVLLVRRPGKGLLGGMLALPTSPWAEGEPLIEGAPLDTEWRDAGAIDHVFTHFAVNLRLLCCEVTTREIEGTWWPVERIGEAGLPTLFARLVERGAAWKAAA